MSSAESVSVGFDAIRVCEAIAKIGYEPYTAIMDIIDNSVTAEASTISISIELRPGKTLKNRNSVSSYKIIDDGKGNFLNRNQFDLIMPRYISVS